MSIPIDKLSLLGALIPLRQQPDSNGNKESKGFAEKLDMALGTVESSGGRTVGNARETAEALTLQMLQSSLDLAGDSHFESSSISKSNQFSSVNTFLHAYHANQTAGGELPVSSPAPRASQLQELAEVLPAASADTPVSSHSEDTAWLDPIIAKASRKYGVDVGLIRAVIKAESDFNPRAVSHAGAVGLMQLMPATARSLGVIDSFDPEQNVMGGTRFLRDMLQRYEGNVDAALSAYNWGPGNVDRRPDHLPRETRDYLARVKQLYASYS
jgi:soluble lytic murein transglycosylase-like protein